MLWLQDPVGHAYTGSGGNQGAHYTVAAGIAVAGSWGAPDLAGGTVAFPAWLWQGRGPHPLPPAVFAVHVSIWHLCTTVFQLHDDGVCTHMVPGYTAGHHP